jgi:hypothetical protein
LSLTATAPGPAKEPARFGIFACRRLPSHAEARAENQRIDVWSTLLFSFQRTDSPLRQGPRILAGGAGLVNPARPTRRRPSGAPVGSLKDSVWDCRPRPGSRRPVSTGRRNLAPLYDPVKDDPRGPRLVAGGMRSVGDGVPDVNLPTEPEARSDVARPRLADSHCRSARLSHSPARDFRAAQRTTTR